MNGPGGGAGGAGGGGGPGGGGAGGGGGGAPGARAARRSRSQGTRKLHKCLSTASDVLAAPPAPQHSLLSTRQYCSFGSTVTLYDVAQSRLSVLKQSQFLFFSVYVIVSVSLVLFDDVALFSSTDRRPDAPRLSRARRSSTKLIIKIINIIGRSYTDRPGPTVSQ